jgi:N-acetylmuramoyl-L-alanine amidase
MATIVIDPGHGGTDPGAVNGSDYEKTFTLDIGLKVRNWLTANTGARVLMTRSTDTTVSLEERVRLANNNGADYFCSIHINAGGGTGFESFIYDGTVSQRTIDAQNTVHAAVMNGIGPKYGVRDRGKKRANFYVLRQTAMPAILLENLFIDTVGDLALLKNAAFIQDLSVAIGSGIAQAFGLRATGSYQEAAVAGNDSLEE